MSPGASDSQVGECGGAATLVPLLLNSGCMFPSGSGRRECALCLVYQLHDPRDNNVEISFALALSFHKAANPGLLPPITPSPPTPYLAAHREDTAMLWVLWGQASGHDSAMTWCCLGLCGESNSQVQHEEA